MRFDEDSIFNNDKIYLNDHSTMKLFPPKSYKNWDYNFDKLRLIRNYHINLEIK